jgi:EAL domain-containing protein (putative c-di-GMP-specific phosphodiesterase class I)
MLGEALLGVVFDGSAEREHVRTTLAALCTSLAEPVQVGDAEFHLKPSAGVAVLGEDASQPAALIQSARSAMLESRRGALGHVQFYSDTLRMLPVARLDVTRELRRAINEGQLRLRYLPRRDLATNRVVALQAYLHWDHPLRGEVPAAEFLRIANATGLAASLSRVALERLRADAPRLLATYGDGTKLSIGTMRHYVTGGPLVEDCRQTIGALGLTRAQLELRMSERTLAAIPQPQQLLGELERLGATVVVEDVGTGHVSLTRLAQLPVSALQIDPAQVAAALNGATAQRVCRAVTAMAAALGIDSVAPGVTHQEVRARMVEFGFTHGVDEGSGDEKHEPDSRSATGASARRR